MIGRTPQFILGTWRGRFIYSEAKLAGISGSDFTLHVVRRGWLGNFGGWAVDDDVTMSSDPPRVEGRVWGSAFSLVKRYSEFWIISDGRTQTLRQWLAESGVNTTSYIPSLVVRYKGSIAPNRLTAKGTWELNHPALRLTAEGRTYLLPAAQADGRWELSKTHDEQPAA